MAESFEIELLAADDDGGDLAHQLRLCCGQPREPADERGGRFQQGALAGIGERMHERCGPLGRGFPAADRTREPIQRRDPQRDGCRARIGKRVAGAGEQVGEARRAAHRRGQQPQRQVK
ncbi:MAG: hypothetical protein MUF86_11630 [Akkermansiaceae bacterium]|nr:hypothetical protein [Akkermansiaceae bacterium]